MILARVPLLSQWPVYGATLALLLTSFAVLSQPAAQTQKLTAITLKHRSAEELKSVVEPLLKQGDYIAGEKDKLLVRTDPETLADVQKVLSQLDRGLQTLTISLRETDAHNTIVDEYRAQTSVAAGKRTGLISSNSGKESGHAAIESSIQPRSFSTSDRSRPGHQLRVLEGAEALFFISQRQPDPVISYGVLGNLQIRSDDQSSVSGFFVQANRLGDKEALVNIRSHHEHPTGKTRIDGQQMVTTLTIPLNQWTTIGGPTVESQQKFRTNLRGSAGLFINRAIQIKVETNEH